MVDTNKLLTLFLAVIICIAAVVLLYINLPKNETIESTSDDGNTNRETEDNETEEPVTVLTVIYGNEQTEYTLEKLESMDNITGYGGYRTSYPMIKGQGTYTGVPITELVELTAGIITNYSLIVTSNEDGDIQNQTYNYSTIQGNINIYNSTNASDNTPIETGDVTMIVFYKEDGEYLEEDIDGKIRIGFVNENEEKITASGLWWKFVVSIKIIES
jgi:hypothetical protein